MSIRTDLAIEGKELAENSSNGIEYNEKTVNGINISKIKITNKVGEKTVGKPKGTYLTAEGLSFLSSVADNDSIYAISNEIKNLIPEKGDVLVTGLGNTDITPDALGPKTVKKILATRHINGDITSNLGLGDLRHVSSVSPGVLGNTGIETAEIILGISQRIKPKAVIVIDSLASRRLSRLGTTVQISDAGIAPGSGVGNKRSEISQKTIGIPVISIGVPTVVDARTIAQDVVLKEVDSEDFKNNSNSMMVTPREIDTVITNASFFIAMAINLSLHPQLSIEEITMLI